MIENHLLHAAAWSLLRVLPPRRAFGWTARIAAVLPRIEANEEALRVAAALDPRGTCLSRSLTLAARLRDAEVVIGVDAGSLASRPASLKAHAWIEWRGGPLREDDVIPGEIARIRAQNTE